jgi:recombinational DNA repair protein RecR
VPKKTLVAGSSTRQDNGLMFCHAKCGTFPRKQFCNLCKQNPCDYNDMLPTVKTIQQFITLETQAKKKKKKKDKQVKALAVAT